MKIKIATNQDIQKIAKLEEECFGNSAWSLHDIKETFENGISVFFVAYFKNEVIGYIGMYSVLDEGYVYNLAVSKNYRKKGVACQLIENLKNYSKEKKLKFISLEVRKSNTPAINLYKKCGFKLKGTRNNFYKNPKEEGMIFTMNNKKLIKIPVEISARHIHIDKECSYALFGKDHKLEIKRQLSQSGQYLCKEKLDIKSGENIIKNVAVLGPFRDKTQIEISITDARKLKISPPIRQSGDTKGSENCILVGPKGEIEIPQGVIISKRHLHIPENLKEELDLKDGETVKIKINSNHRKLIFDDVIVRINKNFNLALHIDTDEGNAAGCTEDTFGEIVYL